MFHRIGFRQAGLRGGEEAQAEGSVPHARPGGPRERTPLHGLLVPTGFHDAPDVEPIDPIDPTGPDADRGLDPEAGPGPESWHEPFEAQAFEEAGPFDEPPPTPAQDEGGRDRRLSCRYQVVDAHGVLCWWETVVERPEPVVSVERPALAPAPAPAQRPETSIYTAVMARGPAFRNVQAMRETAEARREAAAAAQAQTQVQAQAKETTRLKYSQGEVVDISQTGMALLCPDAPPEGQKIWLRLDRPSATEWVEVMLKGVSRADAGRHLVRLAFCVACPYDFFKIAVYAQPKP